MLETADLKQRLPDKAYAEELPAQQVRLRQLQFRLYEEQRPALAVFEGWDAAGKGGAIKRLIETLEPRGYTVSTFAAPKADEKTHHYLWRFYRVLPRAGHLGVWDRSHYGRVLVERVEGFCSEAEWRRAFREINEFEAHHARYGMVIVKFWLHLSAEEQMRRFKNRERDPFRQYKLTEEDWRNRAKRDEYGAAIEEMLERTSTPHAPWVVVEAEDKNWARVKVVRAMADAIEQALDGDRRLA